MATSLRWVAIALWLAVLTVATPAGRRGQAHRKRQKPPKSKLKVDTLDHFAEFCRRFIVLDNGQPFELEPFQRLILKGFFAGVSETLVLLPKKNGKTTLLAALALYHLIYTPDARCYIAASAKDQAKVMYEQATGFLERRDRTTGKLMPQAAALQKRVMLRKGTKEIRSRRDSGFIWVCSGDVNTVDGAIVTLALVDELHRHKDKGALYGVLADGLGPRNGRVVTISTAGESMRTVLGRARAKALKYPSLTRKGKYTFARSPSGDFEMHEWSLGDKDDREDLKLVKQANPLSSNTIASLRRRKKSPFMTPSRWARFGCGVWIMGEDAAYSSIDWKRNGRANLTLKKGPDVVLGLDIGWRWDTTAIVPGEPHDREDLIVCPKCATVLATGKKKKGKAPPDCAACGIAGQEGWWRYRRVRYGKPKVLVPPRNGESLARDRIIEAVLYFRDELGLNVTGVVFDRNAEGENVAQELENEHGIPAIQHSQDPAPMSKASMGFAEALGQDFIEHPDDDEFTAHILACKAQTTKGEAWRVVPPDKNRGQRKHGQQDGEDIEVIDAAVAAVMLHNNVTAPQAPPEEPMDLRDYRIGML